MEQNNFIKLSRSEVSDILNGVTKKPIKNEVTAWFYRQILKENISHKDITFIKQEENESKFFIQDQAGFYQKLAAEAVKDQTTFDSFMSFIKGNPNRLWSVYPRMLPVNTAYQLSQILKDALTINMNDEHFLSAVIKNLSEDPDFIPSCEELVASAVKKAADEDKIFHKTTEFLYLPVVYCMSKETVFKIEKALISNWVFPIGDNNEGGLKDLAFFVDAGLKNRGAEVIDTLEELIKKRAKTHYLVNSIYTQLLSITVRSRELAPYALKCMVNNLEHWKNPIFEENFPRLFHEIRTFQPNLPVDSMEKVLCHMAENSENTPDNLALIEIMEKWPELDTKITCLARRPVGADFSIGTPLFHQIITGSQKHLHSRAHELISFYKLDKEMDTYIELRTMCAAFKDDKVITINE